MWLVITVEVPSDDARDAITEGLFNFGATSVQEAGPALVTYLPAPSDVDTTLRTLQAELQKIAGDDVRLTHRLQADEDWSETWKRGLRPRRVGKHFIVAPSWTEPEVREGDRVITIDPEMAFGTGEHATTRGALRALEQIVRPGDCILDVGTGSAILAIGAAMLGATEVIAVDNDPDAILNARDNVVRNNVADAIQLEESLVDGPYLARFGENHFDIIVANVLSGILKPLLGDFRESVRPDGHIILGGILEQEADEMLEACTAAGLHVINEDLEAEWWGVLLRRGS